MTQAVKWGWGEKKNAWCLQAVHGSVREISSCLLFLFYTLMEKSAGEMATCSDMFITTF